MIEREREILNFVDDLRRGKYEKIIRHNEKNWGEKYKTRSFDRKVYMKDYMTKRNKSVNSVIMCKYECLENPPKKCKFKKCLYI